MTGTTKDRALRILVHASEAISRNTPSQAAFITHPDRHRAALVVAQLINMQLMGSGWYAITMAKIDKLTAAR